MQIQQLIQDLEQIIQDRKNNPSQDSYITQLTSKGLPKVAQKVGEEGVETVIAALAESNERFISESADLFFHLLILCAEKNIKFSQIAEELATRKNRK